MKIRMRPPRPDSVYEAYVWRQNGDHPEDRCETFTGSDGQSFQGEGKVVRYYRHPGVPGEQICELCARTMHEHGWIDQSGPDLAGHRFENNLSNPYHAFFMPEDNRVCPGAMVITSGDSGYYACISPKDFDAVFEVVADGLS